MIKRLVGLDLFRISAALFVFLFHTGHINCSYGILQKFISMGAIFMTGFFMLSGFVLCYVNAFNKNFDIMIFYKKRLIQIMPVYLIISSLWVCLFSKEKIIDEIILLPVTILGIESVFTSLFNISHYGGTWFVSCILFCYFLFPLLNKLISKDNIIYIYILLVFVLIYSSFAVDYFKLHNIYSNPFFRILEFTLGILLCRVWINNKDKYPKLYSIPVIVLEVLIFVVVVTWAVKLNFYHGNYMLYNIFNIPMFTLIIFGLAGFKNYYLEHSKILQYLSSISYVFFLAQFFVWPSVPILLSYVNIDNNITRIIISFILCIMLSIFFYEVFERPLNKYLINKYLRNEGNEN